jgi:hypothetical protein
MRITERTRIKQKASQKRRETKDTLPFGEYINLAYENKAPKLPLHNIEEPEDFSTILLYLEDAAEFLSIAIESITGLSLRLNLFRDNGRLQEQKDSEERDAICYITDEIDDCKRGIEIIRNMLAGYVINGFVLDNDDEERQLEIPNIIVSTNRCTRRAEDHVDEWGDISDKHHDLKRVIQSCEAYVAVTEIINNILQAIYDNPNLDVETRDLFVRVAKFPKILK